MRRRPIPIGLQAGSALISSLFSLCLLGSGCRTGPEARPTGVLQGSQSTVDPSVAQLEADLGRWEGFGFSGAILIARGDRTLLSRGYGYANRSKRTSVTPETLFDIGSLGKQFTAAAILALAEEGGLEIRGSISAVIPDVPADKVAITIHDLLTHTSGISDFGSEAEPVSRDELVEQILAAPLSQLPGTSYEYSNLGYTLLAAIIELASGETFEDYLAQALFAPAGLRHTTFTWLPPGRSGDHLALGYGGARSPSEGEDPRERAETWRRRGSGDVLSTTEDLLTWYRALWAGKVLGAASRDVMFTPHTTAEADFLSYGYGWRMQSTADDERLIWHSGLEESYGTMFRHYLDEDLVLVFLSNLSIGGVPMRGILVPPSRSGPPSSRLFAKAVSAAPIHVRDDSRLTRYQGRYRVGEAGWWEAQVEDSAIVLQAEGQEALDALFPPEDASEPAYQSAGTEAVRLAHCLAGDGCPGKDLLDRIDPFGYADRDASTIAEEWRNHSAELGRLREIRALGTTGLRGRRSDQRVTHVRLVFAGGTVDEHVIWYDDDEIYWIPGRPSTFTIRFNPAPGKGLVGFDLLKQGTYQAELSKGNTNLAIRIGDQVVQGLREP